MNSDVAIPIHIHSPFHPHLFYRLIGSGLYRLCFDRLESGFRNSVIIRRSLLTKRPSDIMFPQNRIDQVIINFTSSVCVEVFDLVQITVTFVPLSAPRVLICHSPSLTADSLYAGRSVRSLPESDYPLSGKNCSCWTD